MESDKVYLTSLPNIAQCSLTILWRLLSVKKIVLRFIFQSTMMNQSIAAGAIQEIVLEQVLAGADITVEIVGTAVVRPAIPHQVVVDSGEGEAVGL